ncbi:hypothetical protein [Streptomyces sp. NPDC006274]|uniref:hypothetical protein n=1 Tax=unclassified Streptomyces TaxID=2593676 RepID=UPI0033B405FD
MGGLREVAAPFVVTGPSGVAVRDRLKDLTAEDEEVLRLVGAHLGSLASRDLKVRCVEGLGHSGESWALRKRGLTGVSSSRWAGSVTKATHDEWALARRGQAVYVKSLEAGVTTIRHRVSLPVGQRGSKRVPGGYRSRREWHAKSRRLRVLEDRLEHWARSCGVKAVAVEDLDFQAEETREKHGRRRRFRQLISGMPTGRLRARLASMADATGIAIIAVDPAYTSKWGAQHWQKPMVGPHRKTSRHDAASTAIGRRAQGHPIRRRTTPPRAHPSDVHGHRTVQAGPGTLGREEPRPRIPGPRTRCVPPDAARTRAIRTPNTVRDVRSEQEWGQVPLLLTD